MMSSHQDLHGRRYVCLARCSTAQQADTSIPDQLKLLRAFGDGHGMTFVDHVILDGVTGSVPGARTDIEQIIQRKRQSNDFDVLLVQDMSRFTRGGAEHGMKMEYDLNAAGVEVIFAADALPEGDHSGIMKSVGFYAAQQYAKAVSFAVARGTMSSIEQGRIGHCMRVPYGVDRLHVSSDCRPLHIIRNLADGTQQKLHPETFAVLDTYAADTGHGRSNHYRLQANERVTLVPGDDQRVEAVRHMFRRRLIDGWAGFRIARELDAMGIRSGNGKPWCVTSINNILRNPVYTGVGIANRYTAAIYHTRSKNAPKPSTTDRKMLASRRKPAQRVRPKSEWIEIEHPLLKDYLGDLRDMAVAWQKKQLAKQAQGHVANPASKDRHADSSYVLKGILRSKQGGHAMTGRTLGKRSNRVRYYAIHRGFTVPAGEQTLRRLIPAEPLEKAVLEMVRDLLLHAPDLRDAIIGMVEKQQREHTRDATDAKKLGAERERVQAQMELIIDSLGSMGRDAVKTKLQQLEAKLATLTERIDQAAAADGAATVDAAGVADQVIARLTQLGDGLDDIPLPSLRQLLAALVAKLEVDLETKAVEVELRLPTWASISRIGAAHGVCLEDKSVQASVFQANPVLLLGTADCRYRRRGRYPCYDCQRGRKAA